MDAYIKDPRSVIFRLTPKMTMTPLRCGISPDDKIILLFRAYLERATKAGPAHNELVMDRVIRFSPKQ